MENIKRNSYLIIAIVLSAIALLSCNPNNDAADPGKKLFSPKATPTKAAGLKATATPTGKSSKAPTPTLIKKPTTRPTARPTAKPTARPTPTSRPAPTAKPKPTSTPAPTKAPTGSSKDAKDIIKVYSDNAMFGSRSMVSISVMGKPDYPGATYFQLSDQNGKRPITAVVSIKKWTTVFPRKEPGNKVTLRLFDKNKKKLSTSNTTLVRK